MAPAYLLSTAGLAACSAYGHGIAAARQQCLRQAAQAGGVRQEQRLLPSWPPHTSLRGHFGAHICDGAHQCLGNSPYYIRRSPSLPI